MRYGRVKIVAIKKCGQGYIHMIVLKAAVHRVMPGGWEGGSLIAL